MEDRGSVQLVVSGDDRPAANRTCWPAQRAMEEKLTAVFAELGHDLVRAHPVDDEAGHGFIDSQRVIHRTAPSEYTAYDFENRRAIYRIYQE